MPGTNKRKIKGKINRYTPERCKNMECFRRSFEREEPSMLLLENDLSGNCFNKCVFKGKFKTVRS